MSDKLELRMYGLVPYNISDKQKSIQFGHAIARYGRAVNKADNPNMSASALETYNDWVDNWETVIMLDGGTTNTRLNDQGLPLGSLNNHLLTLQSKGVDLTTFHEIDLGDQLTAIAFIIDERVFNKEKYPDWITSDTWVKLISSLSKPTPSYDDWVNFIGGPRNVFLREFLGPFKKA